ncbi:MAG: hypothetical protein R2911_35820 [Caldilineaceae bacterium]
MVNAQGLWRRRSEQQGRPLYRLGHPLFDDPNPDIYCHMETTPLFAGDAESHVKLIIKPKDGPLIDVEMANTCAIRRTPAGYGDAGHAGQPRPPRAALEIF